MKREITVSIYAPISVRMIVEPQDIDDPDGPWQCVQVVEATVEITPRGVHESAGDTEREEMDRLARLAPDLDDGRAPTKTVRKKTKGTR